jgi:hypothetical protein
MATLLKVLNNLADIKSAGGVALRVRTQGCLGEDGTHRASLDIVAWLTLKRRAKSAWLVPPSASAFRASRF